MGIFDKLKNVFFEVEEVDEEENESVRDRAPVAKKIDVVETKKKEIEKESSSNTLKFENSTEKTEEKEKDFKFPMGFDDKDFEVEKTIEIYGPIKEKEEPKEEIKEQVELEPIPEVVSDEPPVELPEAKEEYHYEEVRYEEPAKNTYVEEKIEVSHKLYEGREREEEKQGFTPSPIISPIYGILNKNYKKEQIVTKDERKKSEAPSKKDDLDLIREKAYGDLATEISASIDDEVIDIEETPKEKEDLLYDLNDEEPTVKTVTVGDAEEYFNDLGLEYNVDYKVEKEEPKEEVQEEKPKRTRVEKSSIENSEDDKNLFDLIDAMYEDDKE